MASLGFSSASVQIHYTTIRTLAPFCSFTFPSPTSLSHTSVSSVNFSFFWKSKHSLADKFSTQKCESSTIFVIWSSKSFGMVVLHYLVALRHYPCKDQYQVSEYITDRQELSPLAFFSEFCNFATEAFKWVARSICSEQSTRPIWSLTSEVNMGSTSSSYTRRLQNSHITWWNWAICSSGVLKTLVTASKYTKANYQLDDTKLICIARWNFAGASFILDVDKAILSVVCHKNNFVSVTLYHNNLSISTAGI